MGVCIGVCIEVCIRVCIGGVKHAPLHEFLTRLFLETTILYIYIYACHPPQDLRLDCFFRQIKKKSLIPRFLIFGKERFSSM